jgi:hypothetical protein
MPYRSHGRPAGIRVPAEAFFDFKTGISISAKSRPLPASIRFMSSLRADGYP